MKRFLPAVFFFASFLAFALLDLSFHSLALWLGANEYAIASNVVGEFFVPFVPIIVAGLLAGFLAAPYGFVVGLFSVLIGSVVSLLWRYDGIWDTLLHSASNATASISWAAGAGLTGGVVALAGERLRIRRAA